MLNTSLQPMSRIRYPTSRLVAHRHTSLYRRGDRFIRPRPPSGPRFWTLTDLSPQLTRLITHYFKPLASLPTLITLSHQLYSHHHRQQQHISTPFYNSNQSHTPTHHHQNFSKSCSFSSTRPSRHGHPNCTLPPSTQLSEYEFRTILPSSIPSEPTLIKEKGSKFINYVHQINNETDLREALSEIKSEHPRATHWCYAYRLGPRGEDSRANDDGEPSGSAGQPILGQLNSYDITNTLVTVVRYYGGTKLGVSGLIKAYKEGAQTVLDECEIVVKEIESELAIGFDNYEDQNTIFTLLGRYNAEIISFDCWDDIIHEEFDQEVYNCQLELSKLHTSIQPPPEPMPRHEYLIKTKIKLKQRDAVLNLLADIQHASIRTH